MKLYEIKEQFREALDKIEFDPETGEITNADALREVEAAAAEKVEATGLYVRELEAEAEALKAEADRMAKRAKSIQKRGDYLKARLLEALHETGKVKTARVTVSIRKTTAVVVDDNAPLAEEYTTVKTTVTPNKIAIKEVLAAGGEIIGCRLEERESVSIR